MIFSAMGRVLLGLMLSALLVPLAQGQNWQALGEDEQAKYFYRLRNPNLSDDMIALNMRAVAKAPMGVALFSTYRQLCTTVLGGCAAKEEKVDKGSADPRASVQEMEMFLFYNCKSKKYQKQQVFFYEKEGTLISKHTPGKNKPKWRHFMPQNAHLEKYGSHICAMLGKP